jgi:zona occludens toxin
MVLITQHPLLADASIRRLTGKHMHCIRKWGTESSTIHEWASVRDNCDKPAGRKDSTKHAWKFDKSIYALYKSAEVHTIKRNIPKRVIMLCFLPLVLLVAAYAVYWFTIGKKAHPVSPGDPQFVQQGGYQQPAQKEKWQDPVADAKRYAFDATPRIVGLAHTAPKYDAVTAPTTAPMPVSCIASKTKCSCYSQQATVMNVPDLTCRSIVDRGFFVDFALDRDKQPQRQDMQSSYQRADAVALPSVVAEKTDAAADGYGVLGRQGAGVRQPAYDQKVRSVL